MNREEKLEDFYLRSEKTANTSKKDEAFNIISAEIDLCEDRYLNEYIAPLNFIRYEKVLDWIERSSHRIENISENWGHLAASSNFSWDRANTWLSKGRPLSLIALDALKFCTTTGERLNQSPWMREIQPSMIDNPKSEIVAKRLQEYLKIDNVPRTRNSIDTVINNIFGLDAN